MPIKVHTSDESIGFDLNQVGDYVLALNVDADWAWMSVRAIDGGTFGVAKVNLYGSFDAAGVEEREFFEIDPSAELDDFGARRVNVTGIPTLRLRVDTAHGTSSTPCVARIAYAPRSSS